MPGGSSRSSPAETEPNQPLGLSTNPSERLYEIFRNVSWFTRAAIGAA
jgi:hypothetical protein